MNRPGLALLCKSIPTEETHHLSGGATARAGLLCEFFTLVEGHESSDTPGSMGDFAKDGASDADLSEDEGYRDDDTMYRSLRLLTA